jgi:hypothetical protein
MSAVFLSVNPKGTDHVGDVGTDGRIISKWILKNIA